ncbi:hypothetical protein CHS0354_017015 [Potamilus streckersoni]|uniref:Sushi domain-containing protein n=1 Tax=Potamilus streckersoni TaxID=2493646 RepID=A0AAE0SZ42_9BIVA|nr:hypothetical protein CHS0354_017015 [Potamilus streckersoni]
MLTLVLKAFILVSCGIHLGTTAENDGGLIVTMTSRVKNKELSTVPIAQDGTPDLHSIRSISPFTKAEFLSADGDYTFQQAYAYERYTRTIYKNSNFTIDLSVQNIWTPIYKGLSSAYIKLSVDWISQNIYWTDPYYKWIMVQSLLGNDTSIYCVLIQENLQGPYALALDPFEALLFWSDIGTSTKIEVSSLSGRNRTALIFSSLLYPYSLAADYAARRIYFVDDGRHTLETVTYEGKDRKVLLKKSSSKFFDIAVFKDYLYLTDSKSGLYFFNKTNGKELQKLLPLPGKNEKYYAVAVFHPDAQLPPATAYCESYGCEHICVTEKDGASCLCKDGYTLNQDMKTCSLNTESFHLGLVFSNETSVCTLDIRFLTDFSFPPVCVLKTDGTKYMIMDTDDRQMILADDTAIYWAKVDNPELQMLSKLPGTIRLAWDGYDRNLYWTDGNSGIIWRLSRESNVAQKFLEGLKNPRDILIIPHERLVYWISDRNGSTIESSYINGSNLHVVLDSSVLSDPKSLGYDPYAKRIYFLGLKDEDYYFIESCFLDGSNLKEFRSSYDSLEKLEIYKGHMLVTAKDSDRTLITSYDIIEGKTTTTGSIPDTGHISAIKVFDENMRQNETGPCFALNGDCEQICIANGKSRICACTFGFKLAENGKNCTSDPIKDNFMLVTDFTHNAIYQISLTDQSVQGIKTQDTTVLTGVAYSPVNDLVIWGTEEFELYIMHLNGTGKKMLSISVAECKLYYARRFAVDYSTGNIYCTGFICMDVEGATVNHVGVLSPNGKYRILVRGLDEPEGLVVYPSKGKMFYIDSGSKSHLGQASMDGNQSSVLLNLKSVKPTELTVDYKTDYLYWINYKEDSINYCKLDGTDHNTLTKYPKINPLGIAFYEDYLFLSTKVYSYMIKLKISNPNETTEFAEHAELGTISVINIYSSSVQNKNAFCSVDNGNCSTFCFPIPGGRVCGCEDGVELKEGSSTICSNIISCPMEFEHGRVVSPPCTGTIGQRCDYECTESGYKKNEVIPFITCTKSGKWSRHTHCLCQRIP